MKNMIIKVKNQDIQQIGIKNKHIAIYHKYHTLVIVKNRNLMIKKH